MILNRSEINGARPFGLDSSDSGWVPVAGSCEHSGERSNSIKDGEFLAQLNECQLSQKRSAPQSQLLLVLSCINMVRYTFYRRSYNESSFAASKPKYIARWSREDRPVSVKNGLYARAQANGTTISVSIYRSQSLNCKVNVPYLTYWRQQVVYIANVTEIRKAKHCHGLPNVSHI